MSITIMGVVPLPAESLDPPAEKHTFAELVSGREDEFPVLVRALRETEPARSFKIEWLQDDVRRSRVVVKSNYTQIVRKRHFLGDDMKEGALTEFLTAVEDILVNGKPSYTYALGGYPRSDCGGYRHYLRRKHLRDTDTLKLCVLRAPRWRTWSHKLGEDGEWIPVDPVGEWLAEFSLLVTRG